MPPISKKRAAVFLFVAIVVIFLIDSQTEQLVLEDTSLPVGMQRPGPKKTFAEFKQATNKMMDLPIGLPYTLHPEIKLPTYIKYKESLLTPVIDQNVCASCWAISVCHLIADRIALYTKGRIKRPLSHQELVSCHDVKGDNGCTIGGIPESSFQYIIENGIATDEDYPYLQAKSNRIVKCDSSKKKGFRTYAKKGSIRSLCIDPAKYTKGSPEWQKVIDQNTRNMKTELFLNGPIAITIYVYSSLYLHDGLSIYDPKDNELGEYVGGHSALLVGSAEEVDGVEPGFDGKYWILKNSWSAEHPIKSPASKGYLYVRAGRNCCGIESRASTVQVCITDEIKRNMVKSLDECRWLSYNSYSNDPNRTNFIKKSTKLRALLK